MVDPSTAFAIVSNGFADGPAQALRDFLVGRGASVTTVFHPLVPEAGRRHEIVRYHDGQRIEARTVAAPLGPPLSFALDPVIPFRMPVVDTWFGFNSLAAARGLRARRRGRAGKVVYWCVDFVPDRFGRRSPLTRLYDALDRRCCRSADARFELTGEARDARNTRHGLAPETIAPARVVPMGAWLDRVPTVPADGYRHRRVVFLGHLVQRQGVTKLLEALALLQSRGRPVAADVIGSGPIEGELRAQAAALGLSETVRFHGFVAAHSEVETLLASASLAMAPYEPSVDSFTRWADPGKLKAYLAAGLPIVLTDVPPNAAEVAALGGGAITAYDPAALADAIERGLESGEWLRRRAAALAYARRFDWQLVLAEALAAIDD